MCQLFDRIVQGCLLDLFHQHKHRVRYPNNLKRAFWEGGRVVLVVKWSACLLSNVIIWVRILQILHFFVTMLLKRTKTNRKEAEVCPFLLKRDIFGDRFQSKKESFMGSGCGAVGREVASDTRGPRFESSHRQKFIYIFIYLFSVNCVLKRRK